jgi:hypothetical protein
MLERCSFIVGICGKWAPILNLRLKYNEYEIVERTRADENQKGDKPPASGSLTETAARPRALPLRAFSRADKKT